MASPTLSFSCLIAAVRRRLAGERGFTMIEVLVSAVIVAMTAVGTFTAFDSANRTSGYNKARAVATRLAQAEQERVRALTPSQLTTLADASPVTAPGFPKSVDGRNYNVKSSAVWTTDPSATTSCAGMGNEAGYMRITSTVTWDNMGSFNPVVQDSIKAVQNGGFRDARGSLSVQIADRAGTGQSGVPVTITGPRSYSVTTNGNGCVLLGFVPVGTYTVSFNKVGYVLDGLPNAQAVSQTVQVDSEETGTASFNYDQAASLGVKFMTRVPGAGSDIATTGDGFSVAQSGLGFPNAKKFGPYSGANAATLLTGANNAAVTSSPVQVLFPFTSAYGVYAGSCTDTDPTQWPTGSTTKLTLGTSATSLGTSGNGGATLAADGAVTNIPAFEPMMKVTVNRYTNSGQTSTGAITSAAKVVVTPPNTQCAKPLSVNTAANGTIADASQVTMPYDTGYTLCAQDTTTSTGTKTVVKTVDNITRAGQSVTLTLPYSTTSKKSCP